MRRLLFFMLWFVLFTVLALIISGIVIALNSCPDAEEFSVGYDCGKLASEQFMAKYRLPMVVGIFLLSLTGTLAGILPGTKKR